jgi:O-antigen/teichoic acid export membrane protein
MAHRRKLLMLLKACNLVLVTLYSFVLIYVFARILPVEFYTQVVFVGSLANYVLAADLGFSAFLYASVRREFLSGSLSRSRDDISTSFSIYLLVVLAALIALAAVLASDGAVSGEELSLALYFTAVVPGLPWTLYRRLAAALDQLIRFELIELARRTATTLAICSLLLGVDFKTFCLATIGIWLLAYGSAFISLRQAGIRLAWRPRAFAPFLRQNRGGLGRSGIFTGVEFMLYNGPYLAIPFLFADPTAIVIFDLFYKVTRFSGLSYSIAVDSFLPQQTQAFYGNRKELIGPSVRRVALICLAPMLAGSAAILLLGDWAFGRLLPSPYQVTPLVQYCMVGMLAGGLVHSTAGSVLIALGRFGPALRIAAVTLMLLALAMAATVLLDLAFDVFLLLYVAAYWCHGLLFQWLLRRLIR